MDRRICLSIGVSTINRTADRQIGFAVLDGAVSAAKCIGRWADAAGFGAGNVAVVTDERAAGPVTIDRIRTAVAGLFPTDAAPVAHMVLSFCGHGLTGAEVGSIFWLFSDSLEEQYRVNVDAFVAELLKYGAERITLISDACRDGPTGLDLQRLEARRVIIGPSKSVKSPQFDRLSACQDGSTAFMVSEPGAALPGKCVFSGVIADILWRREATAITDGAVTTIGLGAIARSRATERARQYALELYPQCLVDPQSMTLVPAAPVLPPEVGAQPWPAIGPALVIRQIDPQFANDAAAGNLVHAFDIQAFDLQTFDRIDPGQDIHTAILGANFGEGIADLDFAKSFSGFPDRAAGPLAELIELRAVLDANALPSDVRIVAEQQTNTALKQLEAMAATQARQHVATQFRQMSQRPAVGHAASHANLIVVGGGIRAIWGPKNAAIERGASLDDGASTWRIETKPRDRSVVIETDDMIFMPVTLYDGLQATVSADPRGGYVLAYGDEDGGAQSGFDAIGDLAAGTLSPADVDRLVARLRDRKHVDPILGVISAYLYRAIADVDSIRRMAYFYAEHGQAVPFDIAMLGAMHVGLDPSGALAAHVPDVAGRAQPPGDVPDYVTRATPAVSVPVGGCMPWLSIGWDYVSDPDPQSAPLVKGLAPFARDVKRSGFTNLPADAGRRLVAMLKFDPLAMPAVLQP